MTAPTHLSPTAAADLLGISRDSVLRAIKRGDLPAFTYGRLIRISRTDLDAFIAAHQTSPKRGRLRRTA